jgi:hypothetical protein
MLFYFQKMDSENIASEYQEQLNKITGENIITVRIIRDGVSLCFNTSFREIAETLQEMNKDILYYTEKYFLTVVTFAIEIKLSALENTTLNFDKDEFLGVYKKKFQDRIQIITNKYDNIVLGGNFADLYNSIKAEYKELTKSNTINIQDYISIRKKFDNFRDEYKNSK